MKKNTISSRNFLMWILLPLVVFTVQNSAYALPVFTDSTFNNSDWNDVLLTSLSASGSTCTASQDTLNGIPAPSRTTTHTYPAGDIVCAHLYKQSSPYDPATQGEILKLSYSYDLIHYTAGAVRYYPLVLQNGAYYVTQNDVISVNTWQTFSGPSRSNLTAASFVNVANPNEHPDFSCKGAPIVFGYVTRNHNPNPVTTDTTRSGIDNWRISIDEKRLCSCGAISEPRVTCDVGGYTYSFTVTNNSLQTIQYLLLSPALGSTFNISPNVINLGTPLSAGQSRNVTITISNAAAGDHVCIDVGLADKDLISCCMIQTCVDLPKCPCARLLDAIITCGANGSYTYSVPFQNFGTTAVQQIMIVPIQPSNLNFTPQLITLSTPLQPGQTTTVTITITGVHPPTHVCLRIVPLGDNAATCCSIETCFDLPPRHCQPGAQE